ncbi:hypothetical protein KEJ39_03660 [Candidatus Bathyarchaeota archaeon]|nr:hypothetical protein [Candidatus Bathyarchaeota archaeon]
MILLTQIPLSLSVEEALKVGGLGRISEKLHNLEYLMEECRLLIRPAAVYTYVKIREVKHSGILLEDGRELSSPKLAEELRCASEVAPYIATIGPDLEHRVSELGKSRLLDSWVLDNLGTYALRKTSKYIEERIKTERGWNISKFNPGSTHSWGLEQQEVIFSIFSRERVQESIGVVLSDKFVMKPRKTVSGVMAQAKVEYHNCRECPKICEYRQRPFKGQT